LVRPAALFFTAAPGFTFHCFFSAVVFLPSLLFAPQHAPRTQGVDTGSPKPQATLNCKQTPRACRIVFHRSQLEKARNIEGKQTDHKWNQLSGMLMQIFNIVILIALGERIVRPDYENLIDPETGLVIGRRDKPTSFRRKVRGYHHVRPSAACFVMLWSRECP
jgi:hypothetical protein